MGYLAIRYVRSPEAFFDDSSLATLAAQDADETPDRVLLPSGGFHDLGERRALGV